MTTLPPRIDCGVCVAIDRGFTTFTHTTMSPSLVRPAVYPHAEAAPRSATFLSTRCSTASPK